MIIGRTYSKAFWKNVKHPIGYSDELERGKNTETGGYFFPEENYSVLKNKLAKENLFRRYGTFKEATKRDSVIWVSPSYSNIDWTGDHGEIPQVEVKGKDIPIGSHKLATISTLKNDFIGDAKFNVEEYLIGEFSKLFGQAEEDAFINGDGHDQPFGILDDSAGAITGVEEEKDNISFDTLSNLFFSLDKEYRKDAIWLMNDKVAQDLYFLKDAKGNYIWREDSNTLFGKPVVISSHMPNIEEGKKPIAFGDFKYYWLVQRQPLSVMPLREQYILNDETGFIGFERIDGRLIRQDAIKTIKVI